MISAPSGWGALQLDHAQPWPARVRSWIAEFYPSPATRDVYAKGLAKLSLYLQRRQANALFTQPKLPSPPRPPRRSTRYPAVAGQRLPEAVWAEIERTASELGVPV